jgi:hypothetical protein
MEAGPRKRTGSFAFAPRYGLLRNEINLLDVAGRSCHLTSWSLRALVASDEDVAMTFCRVFKKGSAARLAMVTRRAIRPPVRDLRAMDPSLVCVPISLCAARGSSHFLGPLHF